MTLTARLSSAITLLVLLGLLLVFALVGWRLASRPFPARAAAQLCVDRAYHAGDTLSASDVTVSVLNASQREGLAGRTLDSLTGAHFAAGDADTAPSAAKVPRVQIWASDPKDPAVLLVAGWLRDPRIVDHPTTLPGITVVVGEGFTTIKRKGPTSIKATTDGTVCSPVVD